MRAPCGCTDMDCRTNNGPIETAMPTLSLTQLLDRISTPHLSNFSTALLKQVAVELRAETVDAVSMTNAPAHQYEEAGLTALHIVAIAVAALDERPSAKSLLVSAR